MEIVKQKISLKILKTILIVFLGTILLVWISQELAINGRQFALIFMGLLLVIATRYFPDGMFLFFINFIKKIAGKIIGNQK